MEPPPLRPLLLLLVLLRVIGTGCRATQHGSGDHTTEATRFPIIMRMPFGMRIVINLDTTIPLS
jgi:hypothetical protein